MLLNARALFACWFVLGMLLACTGGRDDGLSDSAISRSTGGLKIQVLSNRADLISGGDALVDISLDSGDAVRSVRVRLNGDDVSDTFVPMEDGTLRGLVSGLEVGGNRLFAETDSGSAETEIVNHPNGGPIFSGPQLQPWVCQDGALDEQCNQPAEYSFFYKSSNPLVAGLRPYDLDSPPTDVAMVVTDEGISVPFIVREEIGYQDRDQYRIAVLFQPDKEWTPWSIQEQWNGKILMPGGGGCGAAYGVGLAPTTDYAGTFDFIPQEVPISLGNSPEVALSRGFAVVSTSLSNTGHHCNVVVNAESLMMAKERVVENYGPIRYTIGTGCSGGAILQQTVANAYPGIYQGLITTCSYPDVASPGAQALDYHLLRKYFEAPGRWGAGVVWNPLQWAAVEGHLLPLNAIVMDEGLFKGAITPTAGCDYIGEDIGYEPEANPSGVRCSIFDLLVNTFGPREPEVWSDNEIALGQGFGGIPLGNVGVQYGLKTLQNGLITPAMFVDLNEKIGGLNIDAQWSEGRLKPDAAAMRNVYRSGWMNSASHLDRVAIIDHGGPDPGLAHDAHWAWTMRERLQREQGHFDNHVIWFGQIPLIGDPNYSAQALLAMDRWLSLVEKDIRDIPLPQKIVQNRPGDLHDRCSAVSAISSPDGLAVPVLQPTLDQLLGSTLGPILDGLHDALLQPVLDPALRLVVDPVLDTVCGAGIVGDVLRTEFTTPRGVAGQSGTYDDLNCPLKPLNRNDDYGPFGFTDEQWGRLLATFPEGVCDYSRPGLDKQDTIPWLTYSDSRGQVIYGGKAMPEIPMNSGVGLASIVFR